MAGRGPAPAETRRRANVPQRGEWVELSPLEKRVLPKLPAPPPVIIRVRGEAPKRKRGTWSARTKAAWEAWADDPVTSQFGPAELAAAIELAFVMEDFVRSGQGANEVRLRMDGLGLTPKGKRDLRWRVVAPETDSEERRPATRGSSRSRRGRLSVVK